MKKKLRIYLPFASNELKRQMAYKGAFYLFIFISLFGSFIQYFLWMAIYGSAENAVLGGLTKEEMVVYIFMVYVTSSMVMISISDWVSDDVVKGSVAGGVSFSGAGSVYLDRSGNLQSDSAGTVCDWCGQCAALSGKLYHELLYLCIV